jgi:hypothetical protein
VPDKRAWTLSDLQALPQTSMVIKHICVERLELYRRLDRRFAAPLPRTCRRGSPGQIRRLHDGRATHPPCKPATPRAAYPIQIQRAPPESATGPSGSIWSRWHATARITLPRIDQTHLRRRKGCLFGAELEVRIPFPPAPSLLREFCSPSTSRRSASRTMRAV